MNKLNVGDYVRTDKGEIGKVSSVAKDNLGFGNMEFCNTEPFVYGDIIKSSPKIIDLIERFDFVNGHLVICKKYKDEKDIPTMIKCVGDYYFKEEDIETVITKEQFENISYKVGE